MTMRGESGDVLAAELLSAGADVNATEAVISESPFLIVCVYFCIICIFAAVFSTSFDPPARLDTTSHRCYAWQPQKSDDAYQSWRPVGYEG